jgi:NADPH2:quinone reductase
MFTGQAWRAAEFGQPIDALTLHELSWPVPEAGRVLVKVRACGVGLPDQLMVQGRYRLTPKPPVDPGQEVTGVVVAVAPGSDFAVGDRIMGLTPFPQGHGGFGDYAYVRESKAVTVPTSFTDVEAAGFMIAFRTAHAALVDRIQLQDGQTLGMLGAAGSSGLAAIQLGKALGATVIAVAGSSEKLAFSQEAGADHGIVYRGHDVGAELSGLTGGTGVDVLFDPVGGAVAAQALTGLRTRGQVAVIGFASGEWLDASAAELVMRNHSLVGVFAGGFTAEEDQATNAALLRLAEAGRIRTPVGSVHDFADVPQVLQELGSTTPAGKVVVTR